MEIDIQYRHTQIRKVLVEERQRLRAVDKLNLQPLERVDVDDALHQLQNRQHDCAHSQCHHDIAKAHRQTDARRTPEGSRRRQTGNLMVTHKNRSRAQKTNA